VVEDKVSANEINTSFIINELCDGDANRALKLARDYPRVQVTLAPKSIERYFILEYIELELTDKEIIEALTIDGFTIRKDRIERLRREYENGKRDK